MAITLHQPSATSISLPRLDAAALDTPEAQRALHAGLLAAKRQAMLSAGRLAAWGRPLLIGVLLVSFLHVWEVVASYRPSTVAALTLPGGVYHLAAALLTLAIDLAALYVVAAGAAVAYAGGRRGWWGPGFFLVLTFTLNAAFMVQHAPALPLGLADAALPWLGALFTVLLPAAIPVAIVTIERAAQQCEAARLALLVEVTALTQLAAQKPQSWPPVSAKPTSSVSQQHNVSQAAAQPALNMAARVDAPAQPVYAASEPLQQPREPVSTVPVVSISAQPVYAAPEPVQQEATDANDKSIPAIHACDHCGASLSRAQWLSMRRWGRCKQCPR